MKNITRGLLAGRTRLATLTVTLAILATAGIVFINRAGAQEGGGGATGILTYGPMNLLPAVQSGESPESVRGLIGLLLPAVQRVRAPFRLQFLNQDVNKVIAIDVPETGGPVSSFFDIFVELMGDGSVFHFRNRRTGEDVTVQSHFHDISVRLLPAIQRNGRLVPAVSSAATLRGTMTARMADGSVFPSPFQYSLPAQY